MSKYKEIRGFKIKSLASDPTVDIGQTWYNTTTNTIRFDSVGTGAWATGTNIPAGRQKAVGLGTSNTSAIVAAGQDPGLTKVSETFSWDGSSWTEVNDWNGTARSLLAGIGTATAGLACGGNSPPNRPNVNSWNGTCWSDANDLETGQQDAMGCGTQTAGLLAGGGAQMKYTQLWNGTSWTETNNMNTNREAGGMAFAGTTTATAIATGEPDLTHPSGGPTTYSPNCEVWNGTSWTESGNMSIGRSAPGGTGISTQLIVYGGITKNPSNTYVLSNLSEEFDGTSFSATGAMGTARQMFARSHGTGTAAMALAGGTQPSPHSVVATVEEWDGAPAGVKTVTTS